MSCANCGLHQLEKNLQRVDLLPDDKTLDWSKLKQIADNILSAFKMENQYHIGSKTL